jgi:deoxyadenosine/deoxycytidine kinase
MTQARIGIVGVCASGKSTLARALLAQGFDARQISQEHSYVPDLWRRFSKVDILIYLDVSLATIRQRRGNPNWPEEARDDEVERLRHARAHCHLYICSDGLAAEDVLARVLDFLSTNSIRAHPSGPS